VVHPRERGPYQREKIRVPREPGSRNRLTERAEDKRGVGRTARRDQGFEGPEEKFHRQNVREREFQGSPLSLAGQKSRGGRGAKLSTEKFHPTFRKSAINKNKKGKETGVTSSSRLGDRGGGGRWGMRVPSD